MNADIDELVLSKSGQSVFEAAERSRSGFVRYRGRWIIGVDDRTTQEAADRLPRHRDFEILMPPNYEFSWQRGRRDTNVCAPKWTVVPGKCPRRAQWHIHSIRVLATVLPALQRKFLVQSLPGNWQQLEISAHQPGAVRPVDPQGKRIAANDLRARQLEA